MDLNKIRKEFPSLNLEIDGQPITFFDNAAGTQVTRRCIQRVNDYFLTANANTGGVFETSRRSDRLLEECRQAAADFLNVSDSDEIAFGANMTTLTQAFARAYALSLKEGDEIVTTRLEHEANISPWLALAERGVRIKFADFRYDDITLDLDNLREQLSERTKLVAVGYASNAFGTINPVAEVARLAHEVGARCFVDAVHYSPHGPIDVQALDCDFLVYSAYKSFGPHIGLLWGRRELMDQVAAYHLRTVAAVIPDKFETGTQNHEGIAGTLGALEYLESLAPRSLPSRRERLNMSLTMIKQYEQTLSAKLLDLFESHGHVQVYGIKDPRRLDERVPTFAITLDGYSPRETATRLAQAGINVWSGNYYALEPMTRLGLETRGGAVRISLVHYNSVEEIDMLDLSLSTTEGLSS